MQYVKGRSYFINENDNQNQYEYLNKDEQTEVVIVGGGITGAILSYYFSKNNINTILLEKNRIGYGSTSITTALLQFELDETARIFK